MAVILPSVYKDGTATVAAGGLIVTGQNTLWLKSLLPGDFFGVHKGFAVRIVSVDSNTQLTLANAWPGAAQAAAAYEIMLQSDVARYSEALRQLLEKLSSGNVEALAGLVGAANKFPFFTGAGTMDVGDVSPYARSNVINQTSRANLLSAIGVSANVADLARLSTNLNSEVTNGWVAASGPTTTLNTPGADNFLVNVATWPNASIVIQTAYTIYGPLRKQFHRYRDTGFTWSSWYEQVQQPYPSVRLGGGSNMIGNQVYIGWASDGAALLAQVDGSPIGQIWTDHNALASKASAGYQRLPTGIMIQWGMVVDAVNPDLVANFPLAFSSTAYVMIANPVGDPPASVLWQANCAQYGTGNFVMRRRYTANGGTVAQPPAGSIFPAAWIAIGQWK
jgi:hypothetical protein